MLGCILRGGRVVGDIYIYNLGFRVKELNSSYSIGGLIGYMYIQVDIYIYI